MSWNTSDGARTLRGAEADLIGNAAWQLTETIRESLSIDAPLEFGIPLFDSLTWQQQVLMIDKVLGPLLDSKIAAPKSTALMDASIAAIYAQIAHSVEIEIDMERTSLSAEEGDTDRRQEIVDVLHECSYAGVRPDAECLVMDTWDLVIQCLKDRVLADEDYQMDAQMLDLPPEQSRQLKQAMGIGGDYFIDVAPDATTEDARQAWANIVQRVNGHRPENLSVFP